MNERLCLNTEKEVAFYYVLKIHQPHQPKMLIIN